MEFSQETVDKALREQAEEYKVLLGVLERHMREKFETERKETRDEMAGKKVHIGPRLRDLEPNVFQGTMLENPNDWLKRLKGYFSLNGITDDNDKLQMFKLLLRGVASIWQAQLSEDVAEDYEASIEAFIVRFGNTNSRWQVMKAIEGRKLEEADDMEAYISDIIQLSHKAKMSEPEICNNLLRNLHGDLQSYVIGCDTKTLEDLLAKIRLGVTVMECKPRSTGLSMLQNKAELKTMEEIITEKISEQMSKNEPLRPSKTQNNNRTSQPNQPDFNQSGQWENRTEYNGQRGFRTDATPSSGQNWTQRNWNTQGGTRDSRQIECFYCHKLGHIARNCYTRLNNGREENGPFRGNSQNDYQRNPRFNNNGDYRRSGNWNRGSNDQNNQSRPQPNNPSVNGQREMPNTQYNQRQGWSNWRSD